ncbi:glutaredoxin family protein [Bacillus wiedmannii]|uniref:glutaredoxin family protein n=1 Tax=Bacillus wiedmannii TaxID=1890302 RepID=UPI0009926F32|nr:glutaredoxin family protein [Bacillus wiedmannii]OOR23189.1 NrdH-redoxin [Bacillus wiedmannii]PFY95281.1 glutaredoxin family protein [Bacillus wiedmannii]
MATKIVMYTGNNCGKCKAAKERLNDLPPGHEVELIERNVDLVEGFREELELHYNSRSLPTFIIEGKPYIGFDENIGKIMDVLGL